MGLKTDFRSSSRMTSEVSLPRQPGRFGLVVKPKQDGHNTRLLFPPGSDLVVGKAERGWVVRLRFDLRESS